jgi:hypothetical protein
VEEAIDMTLLIRDKLNEGFNLLRDLSLKLKSINREQKTNAREFGSLRSTLRSITRSEDLNHPQRQNPEEDQIRFIRVWSSFFY